ncbi:MAG: nuclear transport factor 2 family protein [Solobacterium sp.]|nr:nuclear transport factor 2 family protein [Solobacterium sp.]
MINLERKEKLRNQMIRLEAYNEIQNQMGRFTAAINYKEMKCMSFFSNEREDVSLEYADEGIFVGREAIQTFLSESIGKGYEEGELIDFQLTTPIIEVAKDVKSARAVWWSPGITSLAKENNNPQPIWLWGEVAVDFVYENGQWLILHLHYFRTVKCDYHKGWVEDTSMINRPNIPMHPLAQPTTYHNPYHSKAIRYGIPAAPYAYETEDGANWMLRNDKTK